MKKILSIIILICVSCILLSGCATKTASVKIIVSKDANQNTPIRVDLVVVYDKKLFDKIREWNAKQWFNNKDKIKYGFPGLVGVQEWEVIPGQIIPEQTLKFSSVVKGAIVYADYITGGENRVVLENIGNITIHLKPAGLQVDGVELIEPESQNGN